MMTNLTSPITAVPSLQRKFEGRALRSLVSVSYTHLTLPTKRIV